MSIDYRMKFRLHGPLDKDDEPRIRREIVESRDGSKLLSLIYIYGRSFGENEKILGVCDNLIRNPVPGLTAVCMKVLIDYWNKWEIYTHTLEHFLDMSIFEDWYDEVIFAVSYVNRNRNLPFPPALLDRFSAIKDHPALRELFPPKTGET